MPTIEHQGSKNLLHIRSKFLRIGKCLSFGCNPEQTARAAAIVRALARDSQGRVAAARGFFVHSDPTVLDVPLAKPGVQENYRIGPLHISSQYLRLAEVASRSLIRHTRDTAAPDHQSKWDAVLRNLASQNELLGVQRSEIVYVKPWVFTMQERVSVYTRYVFENPDDGLDEPPHRRPGKDTIGLRSIIVSRKHRLPIAEVVIWFRMYNKSGPFERLAALPGWFGTEAKRVSEQVHIERQEARKLLRWAEESIADLESETWNREDAVEDLGGAGLKADVD